MNRSRRGDGEIVVVVVSSPLLCLYFMDECLVAFIWVLKRRKKSLSMPSSSRAFVMPGMKDKRARDSLFGLANRGCYKLPEKHPHSLSLVWKPARERTASNAVPFRNLLPTRQIFWTTLTSYSQLDKSQWWLTRVFTQPVKLYVSKRFYQITSMIRFA